MASFALVVLFTFVTVVSAVLSNEATGTVQFWFVKIVTLQAAADHAIGVDCCALGAVVTASAATSILCLVVPFGASITRLISRRVHNAFATSGDGALDAGLDLGGRSVVTCGGSSCRDTVQRDRRSSGSVHRDQVVTRVALLAFGGVVVADRAHVDFALLARTVGVLGMGGTETFLARLAHVCFEAGDAVGDLAEWCGLCANVAGGVIRVEDWRTSRQITCHKAQETEHGKQLHD